MSNSTTMIKFDCSRFLTQTEKMDTDSKSSLYIKYVPKCCVKRLAAMKNLIDITISAFHTSSGELKWTDWCALRKGLHELRMNVKESCDMVDRKQDEVRDDITV